ncbi:hypothetical protein L207DRAFT_512470 [Hyaloscypha variabilis F]|uniref:Uncharacterized protein n=1 Tax=Hyaloscypha variabilis (strain UAMH 11265 / GT02V1 / F) TaxID=1149755 RepID=A0A2J6RLL0_HYAVF|nr:hypothetical protein L207DRAFT_512470 [Hyaloscypha variabilis F]
MGRFTVLLEYLIARSGALKESEPTSKSTSAPKADEKQPSARIAETTSSAGTEAPLGPDPRVQQVFWHCAEKIRQEMNKKRIKEELKQKKTEMNQAEEKERKQEEIGEKTEKDQAQEEKSEPEGSDKSNPDTVLQHLNRKFYQEFLDMGGKGCLPTNPYRPTVEECGWVAWHLIKAWTAVVQRLSWPKGEDTVQAPGIQADKPNPTSKEKNEVEPRKYWPPQLDEMSYVSAWV